jgi:hypothetical protein
VPDEEESMTSPAMRPVSVNGELQVEATGRGEPVVLVQTP